MCIVLYGVSYLESLSKSGGGRGGGGGGRPLKVKESDDRRESSGFL